MFEDFDVRHMKSENERLKSELIQCEKDKDFVWSLWKRLQSSNPDVSSAVSLVMQREKEKSDDKDRKILEIFESKDHEIEELLENNDKLKVETDNLITERMHLKEDIVSLEEEHQLVTEKIREVELLVSDREFKHKCALQHSEQRIRDLEYELDKVHSLKERHLHEINECKSRENMLTSDLARVKNRVCDLENELHGATTELDELARKHDLALDEINHYKDRMKDQEKISHEEFSEVFQRSEYLASECSRLKSKCTDQECQLREQSDIIKDLKALQCDTEKILRNQEDVLISKNNHVKEEADRLLKDNQFLNKKVESLQIELHEASTQHHKEIVQLRNKISSLQLRDRSSSHSRLLASKNNEIASLRSQNSNFELEITVLKQKIDAIKKAEKPQLKSKKAFSSRNSLYQDRKKLTKKSMSQYKRSSAEINDGNWEDLESSSEDESITIDSTGSSLGKRIVHSARRLSSKCVQTDVSHNDIPTMNRLIQLLNQNKKALHNHDVAMRASATKVRFKDERSSNKHAKTNSTLIEQLKRKNSNLLERIEHLTDQNNAFKNNKDALSKKIDQLSENYESSKSEVANLKSQIRTYKSKERRALNDLELANKERSLLEKHLDSIRSTPEVTPKPKNEVKNLESKLRQSNVELLRVREELKEMSATSAENCKCLTERLERCDKDLAHKRSLIESLRSKVKVLTEEARQMQSLPTKEDQSKVLKDQLQAGRRTIDNLRAQVNRYKTMHNDVSMELEDKNRKLNYLNSRRSAAETFANEVENVATEQLQGMASQTEVAIDSLQSQLRDAGIIVKEFIRFVRALTEELLSKIEIYKKKMYHTLSIKKCSAGMVAAKSKAAQILDLSEEDIDDIMNPGSHGDAYQATLVIKKWSNRCEKILNSNAPFASDLLTLVLEILEEYSNLKIEMMS